MLDVNGADASWGGVGNSLQEQTALHLGGLDVEHAGASRREVWRRMSYMQPTLSVLSNFSLPSSILLSLSACVLLALWKTSQNRREFMQAMRSEHLWINDTVPLVFGRIILGAFHVLSRGSPAESLAAYSSQSVIVTQLLTVPFLVSPSDTLWVWLGLIIKIDPVYLGFIFG